MINLQGMKNMTLSEEVYLKLKNDVNTMAISANAFLNEQQLAEHYGISKAPIRAALHRLCLEGILLSYPRKGYVVVTLSDAEFKHAQNMRVLNECYAVELVAEKVTKEQLQELRILAGKENGVQGNMDFHMALAQLSGNRFLMEIIDRMLCAVTRTLNKLYSFDESQAIYSQRHIEIVDALIASDVERAKELLRDDILR